MAKKITGWKKFILNEISLTLIICSIILITAKSLNIVRVSGMSMFPTYTPHTLLRTDTNIKTIHIGDIVVFTDKGHNHEGDKLIKRVVAVEGDTVQIKEGVLYRNDKKVNEDFDSIKEAGVAEKAIVLKKDEIFVLGDNRNNSIDSRVLGPIKEKQITNIVKGKLLSFLNKNK